MAETLGPLLILGGGGALGPTSALGQGALTGAGIASNIGAGIAERNAFRFQAEQSDIQAQAETLRASETANQLRRNLIQNLASQNAVFGAQGFSTSAIAAQSASANNAALDIQRIETGGRIRTLQAISQSGQLRQQGRSAFLNRIGNSFFQLASLLPGLSNKPKPPTGAKVVGK